MRKQYFFHYDIEKFNLFDKMLRLKILQLSAFLHFPDFFIYGMYIIFQTYNCSSYLGAAILYQLIWCQHIWSQRFVIFYCYLLTIYYKYEQLLYIFLSTKTNISKMISDLSGSYQ